MQQAPPQEQVGYASLNWRFAAVLVDTVVLTGLFLVVITVYVVVLAGQGKIDPNDPAAAQELSRQLTASNLPVNAIFFAALFLYYAVLEALFGASVGKLVFGMRVTMRDGSRATGIAVVLRNAVRIPEAMLLYIPAAVSCVASPQRQRLGDHVARTVVVRRRATRVTVVSASPPQTPPYGQPGGVSPYAQGPGQPAAPAPMAPPVAAPPFDAAPQSGTRPAPDLPAALAGLKTAALAARGAHLTYLRFSERELAAGAGEQTGGYSDEYVSAWFTLTDAVTALKDARSSLDGAAAAAGQTPEAAIAARPDLSHLVSDLAPYFTAGGDDEVHDAFLRVAREDASSA
jgi:uncharacterized RDD family membrane protein YckC